MDLAKIMNSTVGQVFVSAISPKGSATASNGGLSTSSAREAQGHHRHHKSMVDRLSEVQSTIDAALKSGKLTEDQATQMKKELDAINATLDSTQTVASKTLTSDELQKIKGQFQGVRKQLFDALHPQVAAAQSAGMSSLFKKMDANGDGSLDQNEFASFISALV